MKLLKYLVLSILVSMYACTTEEEEEMPLCDYSRFYPEIPEMNFTVNGTNYIQNVGSRTFQDQVNPPELASVYSISEGINGVTNVDLRFTFANLLNDENCSAAYLHRIIIKVNINQGINESKTYPVRLATNSPEVATATYIFEKDNILFPTGSSDSITISRYIPQNRLEGNFSIAFGGTSQTTGSFTLDLKKKY